MISFWRIFLLETLSFVRSKTLALLMTMSVLWVVALPYLVRGDGTPEGLREIDIRYSLGGVFTIVLFALLASATGSLARERAAKRLQLTLVRPVHYASIVLAKALAHVALGALVLVLACGILLARHEPSRLCSHVLSPILPSPREEAKEMYVAFMADPETPEAVKRTNKAIVLRLLENKAIDHYQTIPTNEVVEWKFPLIEETPISPSVRLRFTNQFDTRDFLRGTFRLGACEAVVSNVTQSVLTLPLSFGRPSSTLSFVNHGANALMLRPRKDISVLLPADSFAVNLLRAYLVLVAILAFLIAFALFLSAALGRPVALFVAIITVLVSEMSPSVIEQYPDELETKLSDRIGLILTRATAQVTRPVAALNPLEKLSLDECVEWTTVCRATAIDAIALPFLLSLLSGVILPRKQDD